MDLRNFCFLADFFVTTFKHKKLSSHNFNTSKERIWITTLNIEWHFSKPNALFIFLAHSYVAASL